jgi:hypothetical protein
MLMLSTKFSPWDQAVAYMFSGHKVQMVLYNFRELCAKIWSNRGQEINQEALGFKFSSDS